MVESSRSINHRLNEILSKNNMNRLNKLDESTAFHYASVLKTNILGKDKQEKVNSIVVLAKLLDCIGPESASDDFAQILDHELISTLLSIISINMSSETYKAILKIAVIDICGSVFKLKDNSITKYLPLYESLIEYLDVIDIITSKLYLQDTKIIFNSIKLVTELINKALKFDYSGIITLTGRLKHVLFFSTIDHLTEGSEEKSICEGVEHLKVSYRKLNQYLNAIRFDLSLKPHQTMLNNLFMFLEVSLNEYGTPATTKEYVKAGFSDNPRQYVVDNFSILLAMDLKIFLKDPNFTFKKRFHEELMMSNHLRTFPLSLFIERCSKMWVKIFENKANYPVLSYEFLIYNSMNICLNLWQETKAQIHSKTDIDKIFQLLYSNIEDYDADLAQGKSVEECLDETSTKHSSDMRHVQALQILEKFEERWLARFLEFNKELTEQVWKFVEEQRVVQLLKGSWVFTERFGESLFNASIKPDPNSKYYYIALSPNRKSIYCKLYLEKPEVNPNYEELEKSGIVDLKDVVDIRSAVIGDSLGEADKSKSSKLISIRGTISYEKITLVGAKEKKLLSFYTDSDVNRYVWLDGIKMLRKLKNLSQDTQTQMQSLMEMRRTTQLLGLGRNGGSINNGKSNGNGNSNKVDSDDLETMVGGSALLEEDNVYGINDEDDEDEFFDLDELNTVCTDFYYQ